MKQQTNDELRARFTKWIRTIAYRTRRHYLDTAQKGPVVIPLTETAEAHFAILDEQRTVATDFDFEEERLAQAFSQLPAAKKRVLTMLFVLEESPEKIARELGCTVQNVYNQRSLALKRLRAVMEGGKCDDE